LKKNNDGIEKKRIHTQQKSTHLIHHNRRFFVEKKMEQTTKGINSLVLWFGPLKEKEEIFELGTSIISR